MMRERFESALSRVEELQREHELEEHLQRYFCENAEYISLLAEEFAWVEAGGPLRAEKEELRRHNEAMFIDLVGMNYKKNYANPAYAVKMLGEEFGQALSFLAAELRSFPAFAYEQDLESMTIRMELFLEIYHSFCYAAMEEKGVPAAKDVLETIYWFASDYSETMLEKRARELFDWNRDFAQKIILESDLSDVRYLYRYGEYITENEIRMAEYLSRRSEAEIARMADTYTEGFRKGFELAGKPLHKKKSVNIRYFLGFERVVKKAIENFRAMGLEPVIYRAQASVMEGRGVAKNGYFGASPNKQFDYDHEKDHGLYDDKKYIHRKLENYRNAMESVRDMAVVHAGPAVIECFGAAPFEPKAKPENVTLTEAQQKLSVEYRSQAMDIQREYMNPEERSFTIIAFPVPEIGEKFAEIFEKVMEINTLDYKLYQSIQQKLIDVLDRADTVRIIGCGDNHTDLTVQLHPLADPAKQTNFENCVADVNIPVGEVFTSPQLSGTNGVLHVTEVFLNEVKYLNLEVTFRDGMIADYRCTNFEDPEEGRKLLKEKVLHHHDTLPLGEFAIGTNTTAYVAAMKYQMAEKLPILIAEKMGPHFAVGDTCYSHEEDMITYNPDGKAIVARENEVSALRREDVSKAYFNCHTDITIPYDELGELTAVAADGTETVIIRNGRFVLEGCEELNRPFEEE